MLDLSELWDSINKGGNRPFFITPDQTYTHEDFKLLVCRASFTLRSCKPISGDRVIISLQNEVLASSVFVAALLMGLVPAMLPFDTGKHRKDSIHRLLEPVLVVEGEEMLANEGFELPAEQEHDPEELAYLIFTSGTTGEPAGVEITRYNLASHLGTLTRLFHFNSDTRVFIPTPLSHTDGLIFGLMLTVSTGGSTIRPGAPDLSDFENWIGMITKYSATHMVTNPTVLSLIDRTAASNNCFRTDLFKGILSSASLLRPKLWNHFEERFGVKIYNLYGLTETVTSALYAGRHPEMGRIGTLGKPIDCQARIVPMTASGGQMDIGELELKGPHVFRGYYQNSARTQAAFTPDHWMKTGDMVRMLDDGSFEFLGRAKLVINSGGTLIRGDEIDECLLRHSAVLEAVTLGIEDTTFEEIAVSVVVLSNPVSEAALTDFCRLELERLKVPKRIIAVASIPRGDAGKPNLAALRDLVARHIERIDQSDLADLDVLQQQLLKLAALVFRTDPDKLSLASSAKTVEGWDSFTHINLLLQAEEHFSIRIPSNQIASTKTLSDLYKAIVRLKSRHVT
ncbi:AMP-binding protein [Aestuariivirga sp.]|jgi:long-chain acyl-CoA synthetase|uniref:AMP-binding protein n=1 Tax=Aestuariivirga sp. TaxID=2650926 RepID=UPI0037831FE6